MRMKVRLPYWHQQHTNSSLHDSVFDRWYAQRSLTAAAFGNHYPPHRARPVAFGSELLLQSGNAVAPVLDPFDLLNGEPLLRFAMPQEADDGIAFILDQAQRLSDLFQNHLPSFGFFD